MFMLLIVQVQGSHAISGVKGASLFKPVAVSGLQNTMKGFRTAFPVALEAAA